MGGERIVFAYGDKYVKKYDTGNCQNRQEVKRYNQLKGTPQEKYVFAIVDHAPDYSWVIQERAVTTLDGDIRYSVWKHEIKTVGLSLDLHDWQSHNIGLREDGTWAFLDLGI
jgi:hypothetical protein